MPAGQVAPLIQVAALPPRGAIYPSRAPPASLGCRASAMRSLTSCDNARYVRLVSKWLMSSASTKTRPYRPGLNPPAPLTFRIIFAGALSVPSTTWLKLEADLSTSLVSERFARCLGSPGLTGHGAPIYAAVRPGPSLRIALDGSKAKLWLGGSPQTSLIGVQPR